MKKIWSIIIALIMVLSLMPFSLLVTNAEGDDTSESTKPVIEKPVYVTVTDETGTPKSGATIQVIDSEGNIVETVTNADESFTVFLPAGTYTLKITNAPDGYLSGDTTTITVTLEEAEEKDDIPAGTIHDTVHDEYCRHDPSYLEVYKVYDGGEEITGYCFNQNYDPPELGNDDCKYKRLVGTPELLYELAQCKWLGPDGTGFSAQELYDHVLSMIYHRDYIKEKYGFDDLLTDYIINMAIKQFTDGEMSSFKTTDEEGNNLVLRRDNDGTSGPVVYDENGNYQFRPGGSVLGSVVGHGKGDHPKASFPDYVFPQEFKDAWHELITLTDHPDDFYLYIYYPHNFMTKEEGVEAGWHVPSHYDPEFYYYADAYQCLISGFEVPPLRAELKLYQPTKIEITKTWADENDQDGFRPTAEEYTEMVKLFADGTDVTSTYANTRTVTDNGDNTYTVKFTDLPKMNGEHEIAYTIGETTVREYTPDKTEAADGETITNRHTPEPTEIPVTKEWDDGKNADGVRPESITVRLLADGTEVRSAAITPDENGDWSYTFTDLPKNKDHGTPIVYTITEDPVREYESVIENYHITNKHTPETTTVEGKKTWDDDYDRDEMRPTSITIHLFADGVEVASLKVTEADGWKWSFTDLPKNKDGKEIKYTLKEDRVLGYTAAVYGYDIINSYSPPTGDNDNPWIWITLIALSTFAVAALVVLEWMYRKRTQD